MTGGLGVWSSGVCGLYWVELGCGDNDATSCEKSRTQHGQHKLLRMYTVKCRVTGDKIVAPDDELCPLVGGIEACPVTIKVGHNSDLNWHPTPASTTRLTRRHYNAARLTASQTNGNRRRKAQQPTHNYDLKKISRKCYSQKTPQQ